MYKQKTERGRLSIVLLSQKQINVYIEVLNLVVGYVYT